jgi:hypothetical protein
MDTRAVGEDILRAKLVQQPRICLVVELMACPRCAIKSASTVWRLEAIRNWIDTADVAL